MATTKQDDFFEQFRVLHAMDGKAPLTKAERADYDRVKERFAEAICAAQRLVVKPGRTARSTFRVAILLNLKVTLDGAVQQTATFDVCGGGFSATLATAPAGAGSEASFELFLSKSESISGRARVVEVQSKGRALFDFVELRPAYGERLERLLFDEMLRQVERAATKPR